MQSVTETETKAVQRRFKTTLTTSFLKKRQMSKERRTSKIKYSESLPQLVNKSPMT